MLTKMQCDSILERYDARGYAEAGQLVVRMLRESAGNGFRDLLVSIDSELSAIAHGRPPSDRQELVALYSRLRQSCNSL
jgi:hypothetical protein